VIPQPLYILFAAGFTVAVSRSIGQMVLGPLLSKLSKLEAAVLSFVCGAPLLSLLVFVLASLRIVHKGVLLAAGIALLGISMRVTSSREYAALPRLTGPWRWLFPGVFLVFFGLYLVNAMAPEMSPDGSTYHLGLVSRYYRERGFRPITTHLYANLSQGLEMLFLFAWPFGRHSAAALVHFSFLVALALLILCWGRRVGHTAAGAAAALFLFLSPVVGIDGSSAYNDVGLACTIFAVFYVVELWKQDHDRRWLVPIGLLAGFAYAVKYTGFLAVFYALGAVAWRCWRRRKPVLLPAVTISACAALLIVPWMVKNWVVVRNPVSPFFNRWFPNPYVHVDFEREWSEYLRSYELEDRSQIPLEVTIRGQKLAGLVGPLFLLTPLALLAARIPAGRPVLLAAVIFTLPYPANIGTRFLIPALPFWSLSLALAASLWRPALAVLVLAHALLSWPRNVRRYCDTYAWRIREFPWKAALRITPEELWLGEKAPVYYVARMIEKHVPPGAKVLSFQDVMEAYTNREVLVAYRSAETRLLRDIFLTPLVEEFIPRVKLSFHFPPRTLRAIRVEQMAKAESNIWSVCELRVFLRGRELDRAPEWRLRATPNPWDVQLAFDNSPVTRWRSWQAIEPGMTLQVNFGRDQEVDSVAIEASDDQPNVRLRLHGMSPDGTWSVLSESPQLAGAPVPARLRRYATEELKLRGISYLLIHEQDHGASDLQEKPAAWGVTLIDKAMNAALYRLD